MASIKLKGDTSGEVTISAPAVAGTTTLELPATSSTLATQNALGVRNLIINGDMRIAQRGTSATISTGLTYLIDRFMFQRNEGTVVYEQDTDVPTGQGFTYSAKLSPSVASTSLGSLAQNFIEQRIEGQNLQHLSYGTSNAKTTTASFWVKSNKTGTYILWVYVPNSDRMISKSYTIDSANTWEKKTITIEGDTSGSINNNVNLGMYFRFIICAGSDYQSGTLGTTWRAINSADRYVGQVNLMDSTSNYINITGVQLEEGSATPFEHRPYDMELARCMRYYELINDNNYNSYGVMAGGTSQGFQGCIDYQQIKRATPTITITGSFLIQGNSNQPGTTSMGTSGIGKRSVYISGTGTGSNITNGFAYNLLDVNGYINVDAEL